MYFLSRLVQQEHPLVRERRPERDTRCIISITLYPMVRAVARNLGGAVQVDEIRVRQMLHPAFQVLGRHYFAAE